MLIAINKIIRVFVLVSILISFVVAIEVTTDFNEQLSAGVKLDGEFKMGMLANRKEDISGMQKPQLRITMTPFLNIYAEKFKSKFGFTIDLYKYDSSRAAYVFWEFNEFKLEFGCTKSALNRFKIDPTAGAFCYPPTIEFRNSSKSNQKRFSYDKQVKSGSLLFTDNIYKHDEKKFLAPQICFVTPNMKFVSFSCSYSPYLHSDSYIKDRYRDYNAGNKKESHISKLMNGISLASKFKFKLFDDVSLETVLGFETVEEKVFNLKTNNFSVQNPEAKNRIYNFHLGNKLDINKLTLRSAYDMLVERNDSNISWLVAVSAKYKINNEISLAAGLSHGKQMEHYLDANFRAIPSKDRNCNYTTTVTLGASYTPLKDLTIYLEYAISTTKDYMHKGHVVPNNETSFGISCGAAVKI